MKNEFIGRLRDKNDNFHTYYILEDEFGFAIIQFEIDDRATEYCLEDYTIHRAFMQCIYDNNLIL